MTVLRVCSNVVDLKRRGWEVFSTYVIFVDGMRHIEQRKTNRIDTIKFN